MSDINWRNGDIRHSMIQNGFELIIIVNANRDRCCTWMVKTVDGNLIACGETDNFLAAEKKCLHILEECTRND